MSRTLGTRLVGKITLKNPSNSGNDLGRAAVELVVPLAKDWRQEHAIARAPKAMSAVDQAGDQ